VDICNPNGVKYKVLPSEASVPSTASANSNIFNQHLATLADQTEVSFFDLQVLQVLQGVVKVIT
jgi:hypothetical protein